MSLQPELLAIFVVLISARAFAETATRFAVPLVLGKIFAGLIIGPSGLMWIEISGTLTATSIGVTMRILEQLGIANSLTSEIVLGAAVIDDIFDVILLSLIYEYASNGQVNFVHGIEVIILITVYIFITPPSVRLISTLIEHLENRTKLPDLVPIAMVSLVLFFACLAGGVNRCSRYFGRPYRRPRSLKRVSKRV